MLKKISALLIFLILSLSMAVSAADNKKRPSIYDSSLDVKAELKKAFVTAKKENKNILLMFGADWCPWCHKLHNLFHNNKEIKEYLKKHFITIMVDVGKDRKNPLNQDILKKARVGGLGYPGLAVLNYKGQLLVVQSTGILEKGKAHNPVKVLNFLKVHTN